MSDFKLDMKQAKEALDQHRYSEARDICLAALKEIDKKPGSVAQQKSKVQLLYLAARANYQDGNWVNSLMFLENIIRIANETGDKKLKNEALIWSGKIFLNKGKWEKALKRYDEIINNAGSFQNKLLLGEAYAGKGSVFWRQGKGMEAIVHGKKALDIAKEFKSDELAGKSSSLISNAYFDKGEWDKAIESGEDAIAFYRKTGIKNEIARVLNNQGEVYKVKGEYEKALEHFNEGMEIAKSIGHKRELGYFYMNQAECSVRLNDKAQAENYIKLAEELVKDSEDPYAQAFFGLVNGLYLDARGKPEQAWKSFEKGQKQLIEMGIPFDTGLNQHAHGLSLLNHGQESNGRAKLMEAIESFRAAGSDPLMKRVQKDLENAK